MANDDDRSRRKVQSDRDTKPPRWRETCIGVWSKSASRGHNVNEGEYDKICHGISLVRIYGKNDAPPQQKAHDHTYISVDRTETDSKEQKAEDFNAEPHKDQVPNLTKRVMDIMMMKKTNVERNIEHYKNEGVKLTDICDGVSNTFSKCYETTTRLISYCHPVEKINQVCGFLTNRIKNAKKWTDDSDNKKKK
ncbi:hypothetical protein P5673_021494 [Acropora cervicornis]|uniref:Uncharacterized protein n=1 Tax=Acropora cervicornis TaxID=6130 RepID=A0AAD9V0S7_ACRCE|nr:hypothetical protein P5673_021494 [Acropora cervicornis]